MKNEWDGYLSIQDWNMHWGVYYKENVSETPEEIFSEDISNHVFDAIKYSLSYTVQNQPPIAFYKLLGDPDIAKAKEQESATISVPGLQHKSQPTVEWYGSGRSADNDSLPVQQDVVPVTKELYEEMKKQIEDNRKYILEVEEVLTAARNIVKADKMCYPKAVISELIGNMEDSLKKLYGIKD